jgi:hypothetical protein
VKVAVALLVGSDFTDGRLSGGTLHGFDGVGRGRFTPLSATSPLGVVSSPGVFNTTKPNVSVADGPPVGQKMKMGAWNTVAFSAPPGLRPEPSLRQRPTASAPARGTGEASSRLPPFREAAFAARVPHEYPLHGCTRAGVSLGYRPCAIAEPTA